MNLNDIKVGAMQSISLSEFRRHPEECERMMDRNLIEDISTILVHHKAEKIEKENYVIKRIELYATTPEEFWEIVQREAEKIAMWFLR